MGGVGRFLAFGLGAFFMTALAPSRCLRFLGITLLLGGARKVGGGTNSVPRRQRAAQKTLTSRATGLQPVLDRFSKEQ
jgi:hypothetical protein